MFHYFLLFFSFCSFVFMQAFEVQNVTASQRTDGSHIVDVCYDLSQDDLFLSYRVWSELSIDSGENWMGLDIPTEANIMGDNVFSGDNKCFEISLGDYLSDTYTTTAQVRVFAEGHEALVLPFDMVPVAAGEYMGDSYTPSSYFVDSLKTINYDYEIMKYEVTNAEYAEFLIEASANGYLVDCDVQSNPCGLCVNMPAHTFVPMDTSLGNYTVSQPDNNGSYGKLFSHGTEPGESIVNQSAIYWNGTTFVIEEGYRDHPVIRVSYYGAWAFANYYGMRIPTRQEWLKAARGMNDWQAAFGPEAGNPIPSDRVNMRDSGDPFDPGHNHTGRSTTPVGFFNGEENEWGYETIDSPSPYGTYDQTGNANEWVATARRHTALYILGSSFGDWWYNGGTAYHNSSWHHASVSSYSLTYGFRCVRTIATPSDQETNTNSNINK